MLGYRKRLPNFVVTSMGLSGRIGLCGDMLGLEIRDSGLRFPTLQGTFLGVSMQKKVVVCLFLGSPPNCGSYWGSGLKKNDKKPRTQQLSRKMPGELDFETTSNNVPRESSLKKRCENASRESSFSSPKSKDALRESSIWRQNVSTFHAGARFREKM